GGRSRAPRFGDFRRKNFSHYRTSFPFCSELSCSTAEQGTRKLDPEQVVSLCMSDTKHFGAQSSSGSRHGSAERQGRRRNFKHYLREKRRRTPNDDEGTASADVQRSGKLQ